MKRLPLGRDAGIHVGDQLRQDRHAHAQPDDRRRDDASRAAGTRSPARATRPRAPSRTCSDEPAVTWTTSCCRWSWPRTRPCTTARSSATRPRAPWSCWREGRRRRRRHPAALPAGRRAPVRRRLQAHGDLPPDDATRPAGTSCGASSRAPPTSCLPAPPTVWTRSTGTLVPVDGGLPHSATWTRTERLGEQGLRVLATGRKDFDPAAFDPAATCSSQ